MKAILLFSPQVRKIIIVMDVFSTDAPPDLFNLEDDDDEHEHKD